MAQHAPGNNPYRSSGYESERRALLSSPAGQFCIHCGEPATEADHQPPLSLHQHVAGTGCCRLVPSCFTCGRRQGGELWDAGQRALYEAVIVEPEGFGVDAAVWDVPWLDDLRDVPANGTWPRLMTVPHPRAVGSIGEEVHAWCRSRRGGVGWRWWQRLSARRVFEVDVDGRLVWETVLLSLARQLGKTWWLHDVCNWRFESAARFGEPQVVLSTGKDVEVVHGMQRPARTAARIHGFPYKPREVNGQSGIDRLDDDSRWLVRSQQGVYGNTCSMCSVDEAWKVMASVIEDGVIPTMVEKDQTQLLLISTAHRRASALMIGRRATALEQLGAPDDDAPLLLEWSSPRGELEDRGGWRQASPYWTPKRERWIAQRLAAARSGESDDADEPDPIESFRAQWLNQWPAKRVASIKGDPLVEPGEWESAMCDIDSVGALVIGVEDHHGHGAAVAFVGVIPDGRWVIGGETFASRADAYATAAAAAADRPGSVIVVGASLAKDAELLMMPTHRIEKAGISETSSSMANLRDLLATGRALQDGSPELTGQLHQARVVTGTNGLSLIPRTRSDLLRAAVWALRVASTQPALEPAIR